MKSANNVGHEEEDLGRLERVRRILRDLMALNREGTQYFVRFYDHFVEFQQFFIVTEYCLVNRFQVLIISFFFISFIICFFSGRNFTKALRHTEKRN